MWTQAIDPFNNIALSALVALLPIAFSFWALIIRRMKGYQASLLATLVAIVIAVLVGLRAKYRCVLCGGFVVGYIRNGADKDYARRDLDLPNNLVIFLEEYETQPRLTRTVYSLGT